jgi:hypothetical protein
MKSVNFHTFRLMTINSNPQEKQALPGCKRTLAATGHTCSHGGVWAERIQTTWNKHADAEQLAQ